MSSPKAIIPPIFSVFFNGLFIKLDPKEYPPYFPSLVHPSLHTQLILVFACQFGAPYQWPEPAVSTSSSRMTPSETISKS